MRCLLRLFALAGRAGCSVSLHNLRIMLDGPRRMGACRRQSGHCRRSCSQPLFIVRMPGPRVSAPRGSNMSSRPANDVGSARAHAKNIPENTKRVELRRLHTAEVIARHSGSIFPPLQVAPSFACSVASLNQSPGHQLSGCHGLRCGILTDYQLGWGRPSTWLARHACAPLRSNTPFPLGDRRMDTPSE